MNESTPMRQEGIEQQLIEEIYQLQKTAPEAGHVTCQACAQPLPDGSEVTAYAVRPCRHTPWTVAQLRCGDHPLSLTNHTTLGVHERLVTGRLARVVDQASQRAWPITITDNTIATSPPQTTTVQEARA